MAKKKSAAPKKLPPLAFRVFPDAGGFKWALQTGDGVVLAFSSPDPFTTEKAARAGVEKFRALVAAGKTIPVLRSDE